MGRRCKTRTEVHIVSTFFESMAAGFGGGNLSLLGQ
jgi:hypothetical protein